MKNINFFSPRRNWKVCWRVCVVCVLLCCVCCFSISQFSMNNIINVKQFCRVSVSVALWILIFFFSSIDVLTIFSPTLCVYGGLWNIIYIYILYMCIYIGLLFVCFENVCVRMGVWVSVPALFCVFMYIIQPWAMISRRLIKTSTVSDWRSYNSENDSQLWTIKF